MTDDIIIKTFLKACRNRKSQKGLIFHFDRGSQYISNDFERLLIELNVNHSYRKKVMEVWNHSIQFTNIIRKRCGNYLSLDSCSHLYIFSINTHLSVMYFLKIQNIIYLHYLTKWYLFFYRRNKMIIQQI